MLTCTIPVLYYSKLCYSVVYHTIQYNKVNVLGEFQIEFDRAAPYSSCGSCTLRSKTSPVTPRAKLNHPDIPEIPGRHTGPVSHQRYWAVPRDI